MKKRVILIIFVMIITLIFCGFGYNKSLIDLTYAFDEAIISLPNGQIIQGDVDTWTDFEDGDQLQVTIDGTTYLTHSSNVVLIAH